MLVTLDTSHFERSPLNDVARENMLLISITLDTSHFERSPLNDFASVNNWEISVTVATSHSAIGPCGPLVQSLFEIHEVDFRHASTALLSSVLDCGESAEVGDRALALDRNIGTGTALYKGMLTGCEL